MDGPHDASGIPMMAFCGRHDDARIRLLIERLCRLRREEQLAACLQRSVSALANNGSC